MAHQFVESSGTTSTCRNKRGAYWHGIEKTTDQALSFAAWLLKQQGRLSRQ